jgi:hypothetical protein
MEVRMGEHIAGLVVKQEKVTVLLEDKFQLWRLE